MSSGRGVLFGTYLFQIYIRSLVGSGETELQDIVQIYVRVKDRISNSGEVALYGSTGVIVRTNSASYKENIVP